MLYFSKMLYFLLCTQNSNIKQGYMTLGGQSFFLNVPLARERATEKSGGDTCVYEDGIIQIILLMARLSKLYKTSLFYKNVSIISILTNISSAWAPNLVSKSCVCSKDNTQFCLWDTWILFGITQRQWASCHVVFGDSSGVMEACTEVTT